MRDERLYIDNELVDINADTRITMDIRSNLFRSITDLANNSTLSIRLPKTARNQRIFEHADLVQSTGDFAYKGHDVSYIRNGVNLIKYGNVTVLRVTDTAIEITIRWGLSGLLEYLSRRGLMLNELELDDKIRLEKENEIHKRTELLERGYGYANYDPMVHEDNVSYEWRSSHYMTLPSSGTRQVNEWRWGGRNSGSGAPKKTYIHPVVCASWVLKKIKELYNMEFRFTKKEKEYIDTLVMPLVTKKPNALTYSDKYFADLRPTTDNGRVPLNVIGGNGLFNVDGDTLVAATTADVLFDIKGKWEFSLQGMKPSGTGGHGGGFWNEDGTGTAGGKDDRFTTANAYWLELKITGGEERTYIMGADNTSGFTFSVPSGYRGMVAFDYVGYGKIRINEGERITFEWNKASAFSLKAAKFNGGSVAASLMKGDNVPYNTYYPIAANLPKIKVLDFVKFLSAITGTFPIKGKSTEWRTIFKPLTAIWEGRKDARDWTNRVIAQGSENKPKDIAFRLDGYAQNNWYRWKKDEGVNGNYDGNMQVNNKTLDKEVTLFEFPFAATDGDNVPMYKDNSTLTEYKEPTYKACKDRILRIGEDKGGYATLYFDMDMQRILSEKYGLIRNALQNAKIITEKMRIRDTDIAHFDETRPIYLAQYGAYFAILQIRTDDNGLADVTMLKLNF